MKSYNLSKNKYVTKRHKLILFIFFVLVLFEWHVFASGEKDSPQSITPARTYSKEIEIGYMPILPVAQYFIMAEKNMLTGAGISYSDVRFSDGPSIVQAMGSGKLDVVFFGIGPAMVAKANGQDIKVVASAVIEQIGLIGSQDLARLYKQNTPETFFSAFENEYGRKVKIATFPAGSVPHTVLTYWLEKQLGISQESIEIITMGANRVQQGLLTGAVDGASILEPILTIALDRIEGSEIITRSSAMFPDQPGAVLVVRQELIDSHPQMVKDIVAAHIKATEFLNTEKAEAAILINRFIGQGFIKPEVIEKALHSPVSNYVSDPRIIIESTKRMRDFQKEQGTLKKEVDIDALIDPSIYLELQP